jgi:hypothetical protein
MHAKHSKQQPIIEGLVLGLREVFKIHRLIECYTPYGPRIFSSGSFQYSLPSYRTLHVQCTGETASSIHQCSSWRSSLVIGRQEAENAL